jgi:hypothetical protein
MPTPPKSKRCPHVRLAAQATSGRTPQMLSLLLELARR